MFHGLFAAFDTLDYLYFAALSSLGFQDATLSYIPSFLIGYSSRTVPITQ
jgi:hypothetical protein